MLAISPLRSSNADEGFSTATADSFSDINFDDLFVGFNDVDILPDLEVDPAEIFADFSFSGGEESAGGTDREKVSPESGATREDNKDLSLQGEVVSANSVRSDESSEEGSRGRKRPSVAGQSKGSQGKRKLKVDWTPELHRRFVQAVEQLGVDKAVPSRILELMGIDCLTRHNIASHLQKYRSHRKHLLAREAEAASWSHRRQMYGSGGSGGTKRVDGNPWLAPTIGFPPPPPPPPPPIHHPLRPPLHVWGHPTLVDPSRLLPVWPRHLSPRSLSPSWPPRPHLPIAPDPSYWHPHYSIRGSREGWGPNCLAQATPCFPPQPLPATSFPAPPVPGIPPHPMYRSQNVVSPPPSKHSGLQLQMDVQPSNESIDAAIGDVLAKPWLPLPLGLKPPSLESVMVELQRQGVSKVPPTCSG